MFKEGFKSIFMCNSNAHIWQSYFTPIRNGSEILEVIVSDPLLLNKGHEYEGKVSCHLSYFKAKITFDDTTHAFHLWRAR